ncbi:MAG: alpha/beta fold hydrolase [Snowella sp.]|nr:alpha/beta fold hydrolase [Snowella sp.]
MSNWNIAKIGDQELKGQVSAAKNYWLPFSYPYENYEIKIYGYGESQIDLDLNKETVVLAHGWLGAFGNPFDYPLENSDSGVAELADELSQYYQVLFLDWSTAAEDDLTLRPLGAAGKILPVANWVAGQLAPLNNNITFIGHSLGGLMAAAVGNILHSSEDFDIITLDAAFQATEYDLDRGASDTQRVRNLRDVSDNSIAFVAADFGPAVGLAGDNDYSRTADRSFSVQFKDGTGDIEGGDHSAVQFVYEKLLAGIGAPNKLELFQRFLDSFGENERTQGGSDHEGYIKVKVNGKDVEITEFKIFSEKEGFFNQDETLVDRKNIDQDENITNETKGKNNHDVIFGFGGNDYIKSDENNVNYGDDTLDGGKGNDILIGGKDNDILDGGEEEDTAVFSDKFENYDISLPSDNGVFFISHV